MTSGIFVCGLTRGSASPECISDSTRANLFPSFPPGCKLAKSSSLNPRFSLSVTASASPNASIVVVEAVGARPSEQASLAIEQSSATSAACAKVDAGVERAPSPADFDFDFALNSTLAPGSFADDFASPLGSLLLPAFRGVGAPRPPPDSHPRPTRQRAQRLRLNTHHVLADVFHSMKTGKRMLARYGWDAV